MKTLKRKPIQIYIEPGQDALLEILSRSKGISKAAVIRDSIDKYLKELPIEKDPAMDLVGMGSSGTRDLAENHDQHLVAHTAPADK